MRDFVEVIDQRGLLGGLGKVHRLHPGQVPLRPRIHARQERLIATEDRLHRTVIERIGAPHREPEHDAETPPCA